MSHNQLNDPEEIALQQWIDDLLTAPESRQTAPPELHRSFLQTLQPARRSSYFVKSAMAAAILAVCCWPFFDFNTDEPIVAKQLPTAHQEQLAAVEISSPEKPDTTKATFVPDSDYLVVELESPSPNVTVLQVHPTLSARRHQQREALLKSTLASYKGG